MRQKFITAFSVIGFTILTAGPVLSQEGPACAVLRAADVSTVLPGNVGYNSNSFRQGDFDVSLCNAIGDDRQFVSLIVYSFVDPPNQDFADLYGVLLDVHDDTIRSLEGSPVTDNASYNRETGHLFFWNTAGTTMYVIRGETDTRELTEQHARLIATSLGLDRDEAEQVQFN